MCRHTCTLQLFASVSLSSPAAKILWYSDTRTAIQDMLTRRLAGLVNVMKRGCNSSFKTELDLLQTCRLTAAAIQACHCGKANHILSAYSAALCRCCRGTTGPEGKQEPSFHMLLYPSSMATCMRCLWHFIHAFDLQP